MIFLVVLTVVLLIGCATTSIGPIEGKYPKTPDGQCKIQTDFTIRKFDDKSTVWSVDDYIVIPAGKHTLRGSRSGELTIIPGKTIRVREVDLYGNERNTYLTEDIFDPNRRVLPFNIIWEVTYEFQKGKTYHISGNSLSKHIDYKNGELIVNEGSELIFNNGGLYGVTVKPEVKVKETNGSPYITPEATGLVGAGLAYGGITLGGFGERFGIGILAGKMDLKLVGLGQVGMLIPFGGLDRMPGLQYNFGGLLEYHFPRIGIGAGGGMGGSLLPYEVRVGGYDYNPEMETQWENELWPYLEFNISFRGDINERHQVIYFHYYPSWGDEWYKTFGFGWKMNLL